MSAPSLRFMSGIAEYGPEVYQPTGWPMVALSFLGVAAGITYFSLDAKVYVYCTCRWAQTRTSAPAGCTLARLANLHLQNSLHNLVG